MTKRKLVHLSPPDSKLYEIWKDSAQSFPLDFKLCQKCSSAFKRWWERHPEVRATCGQDKDKASKKSTIASPLQFAPAITPIQDPKFTSLENQAICYSDSSQITPHMSFFLSSGEHVVFELNVNHITIGRAHDNDLILPEPTVSSYHGEFTKCRGSYQYRDRASTNGSKVNGKDAKIAFLKPGDQLTLGDCEGVYAAGLVKNMLRRKTHTKDHTQSSPPPKIELDSLYTALYGTKNYDLILAIRDPLAREAAIRKKIWQDHLILPGTDDAAMAARYSRPENIDFLHSMMQSHLQQFLDNWLKENMYK